ncbi:MAG: rRNA maturation RNase YbeY [Actinomycetota bacterium]
MSDPAPTAAVIAVDEQATIPIDLDRWSSLAIASFATRGITAGECNLLFVDEATIHELNLEHRGKDRPTDVLSFPLDGAEASHPDDLIGDIVICPTIAAANAPEHAGQDHHTGSLDDELGLLVVHGVLHLLGFDHEDDDEAEAMEALEQSLLAAHHR